MKNGTTPHGIGHGTGSVRADQRRSSYSVPDGCSFIYIASTFSYVAETRPGSLSRKRQRERLHSSPGLMTPRTHDGLDAFLPAAACRAEEFLDFGTALAL